MFHSNCPLFASGHFHFTGVEFSIAPGRLFQTGEDTLLDNRRLFCYLRFYFNLMLMELVISVAQCTVTSCCLLDITTPCSTALHRYLYLLLGQDLLVVQILGELYFLVIVPTCCEIPYIFVRLCQAKSFSVTQKYTVLQSPRHGVL